MKSYATMNKLRGIIKKVKNKLPRIGVTGFNLIITILSTITAVAAFVFGIKFQTFQEKTIKADLHEELIDGVLDLSLSASETANYIGYGMNIAPDLPINATLDSALRAIDSRNCVKRIDKSLSKLSMVSKNEHYDSILFYLNSYYKKRSRCFGLLKQHACLMQNDSVLRQAELNSFSRAFDSIISSTNDTLMMLLREYDFTLEKKYSIVLCEDKLSELVLVDYEGAVQFTDGINLHNLVDHFSYTIDEGLYTALLDYLECEKILFWALSATNPKTDKDFVEYRKRNEPFPDYWPTY